MPIYTLYHRLGPIGFFTKPEFIFAIVHSWEKSDFMIMSSLLYEDKQKEHAFVVYFRRTNFLAYVSNDELRAKKAMNTLARLDFVVPDVVKYKLNDITPEGQRILTFAKDYLNYAQLSDEDKKKIQSENSETMKNIFGIESSASEKNSDEFFKNMEKEADEEMQKFLDE
jgi:hypothetical protein